MPSKRSFKVWLSCPHCYGTRRESWPQKEYVFPDHPDNFYGCKTCERKVPWDQWLCSNWDAAIDPRAVGPIGRLPSLAELLNVYGRPLSRDV